MKEIKSVCIIGAGTMGSGIAQAFAQSKFLVYLVDIKQEFLEKGIKNIRVPLEKRVEKGKMKKEEVEDILSRIKATTDISIAKDADIAIEAIYEDMDAKKALFKNLDLVFKPTTIFATNTSTLSVNEMAEVTNRADRFAGMHFFYPAVINQLIEIIPTKKTSNETIETFRNLCKAIDKIPIIVSDSPGFAINRFFVPFLNESCKILEEKFANIKTIDEAGKQAFGISMGAFELMNATGIPIAYHSQASLYKGLGGFYMPSELLKKQFESGKQWVIEGEVEKNKIEEIRNRYYGLIFGITAKIVEEGISKIEDIDRGALIGLRWEKGPFALMNTIGIEKAYEIVKNFARNAPNFEIPENLKKKSVAKERWEIPKIKINIEGRIGIVSINRPEALNALNTEVLDELSKRINEMKDLDVIIITGEGRAFVAGADIKEMVNKSPLEAREFTALGQKVFSELENMCQPTIAAVNGFALGGGCELALACDIIIAQDDAKFGLPEVTLGIHPGFGGTQRLPRRIGLGKAKELIFTGNMIDAKEAERIGLVNKVVPKGLLMQEAINIAKKICDCAPIAVKLAKSAINRGIEANIETGLAYERECISLTFSSEDKIEGMNAFIEKRKPTFKGR